MINLNKRVTASPQLLCYSLLAWLDYIQVTYQRASSNILLDAQSQFWKGGMCYQGIYAWYSYQHNISAKRAQAMASLQSLKHPHKLTLLQFFLVCWLPDLNQTHLGTEVFNFEIKSLVQLTNFRDSPATQCCRCNNMVALKWLQGCLSISLLYAWNKCYRVDLMKQTLNIWPFSQRFVFSGKANGERVKLYSEVKWYTIIVSVRNSTSSPWRFIISTSLVLTLRIVNNLRSFLT